MPGIGLGFFDQPFMCQAQGLPPETITVDDGDDYAAQEIVDDTLNGGKVNPSYPWSGKWRRREGAIGILVEDDFEEYADGDPIDGEDGGYNWSGDWVNR